MKPLQAFLFLLVILACLIKPAHAINGKIRLGYYAKDTLNYAKQPNPNRFVLDLQLVAPFKHLDVVGGIKTYMTGVSSAGFSPITTIYSAGVQSKPHNGFVLGAVHDCWHGVDREAESIVRDLIYLDYTF